MSFFDKLKDKVKSLTREKSADELADELRVVKEQRLKEEGRAKLINLKAKEQERYKKARAVSGGGSSFGGGFGRAFMENAGKISLVGPPTLGGGTMPSGFGMQPTLGVQAKKPMMGKKKKRSGKIKKVVFYK